MNLNQFTQKSLEAIQSAQSLAVENGNQQVSQPHLLLSLPSFSKNSWKLRYDASLPPPEAASLHMESTTARYAPW